LAPMAMLAVLYPPDHPYHWTTIGEIDDLNRVQLDEVRQFFATYYHAANASLALAGDIDPEDAFDLVRAYFGDFNPGPHPMGVLPSAPSVAAEKRLLIEDRVELPRL